MAYDKKKDYSQLLDFLIKTNAPKEAVKEAADKRREKIDGDKALENYRYDDISAEAEKYLNTEKLIDKKEESIKNFNEAADRNTENIVRKLEKEKDSLGDSYDKLQNDAYKNARLSAIGNNERMADSGLSKGLYGGAVSGYGENAGADLDANLQNNIIALEKERESKIAEFNDKIREALDNGEYRKAQNLVDIAGKYDFEINNQQNIDRENEYRAEKDKAEREFNEKQYNDRRFDSQRDYQDKKNQQSFENEMALKEFELERRYREGLITKNQFEAQLAELKAQAAEIENSQKTRGDYKNSAEFNEIIKKAISGKYPLGALLSTYSDTLDRLGYEAISELADTYYKASKNLQA